MNLIEWGKNPDYPMNFTTCRTCGQEGLMKQAWDLRGSLCIDAKACLHRASCTADVRPETVFVGGFDKTNAADFVAAVEAVSAPESVPEPEKTIFITDNGMQHFVCEKCNISWSRPSTRGRPPKVCLDCRG